MEKRKAIIITVSAIVIIGVVLFYFFHPHSYVLAESKKPTCLEDGYELYRCWCGSENITEQKQLGHKYKAETEEPTCTKDGNTVYTCELCGDTYDEPIEAIGHDYEETVTDPTCTEEGKKTYKCKNCEDTYEEEIQALGHEYKDGVCIRCGEADSSAKPESKKPSEAKPGTEKSHVDNANTPNPSENTPTNIRIDPDYGSLTDADWAAAGYEVIADPDACDFSDPYGLYFE